MTIFETHYALCLEKEKRPEMEFPDFRENHEHP